ncbi:response regulator [Tautonia sociabilis]|nr:response regulator [Tautonia sociabilis]
MRLGPKVPSYAIALLSVALAVVLKWAVDPVGERDYSPFVFFSASVTLTAWYGGLMPGLVALLLSLAASAHSFLPPAGEFRVEDGSAWYRLLAFLFEGLIICMVCEALHRSRIRAERSGAEARKALLAWRSSEARFRRLAESDVIGVVSGRDETILEANDAFLRMLGYDRQHLEGGGLSVAAITPESLHSEDGRLFDLLFRTGSLPPFEKEYLTADGRRVPVLIGAALVEPGQADWVAFVLDLSRQKRVERELADTIGRAEAASRAKSEFLAVLSHELITPMNAILGMIQLVLASERDPTLRDYLGTARESAQALLVLLSDLLDYSSIEAGGFELEPAPFHLRAAVDQAIRPLAARAARKGLELVAEVADSAPDRLVGDSRRLRQVLVNLLDNAIKFTRQGEVTVLVSPILDAGADPDRRDGQGVSDGDEVALRFEVADTGIGIAPEDQERIFSPFTQIDASSTRPYSGTGLGLSICRQIVGLMGGTIALVSRPGAGSRFVFTARFRRLPEAADEPPSGPELAGLPVLVVDDNAASRRQLETTLAGWSMRPAAAPDGRSALAMLAEAAGRGDPFPLVLLDAQMPGLDSAAVADRIRRERLAGATILMRSPVDPRTGSTPLDHRWGASVAAVVEKPVTPSRLRNALCSALGGVSPPLAKASASPTATRPASQPLEILLAEDTPANQKLALAVLRRRGHRVDLAANGREAVELASRRRYDLILMDIQMPVMDGLQAAGAIRSLSGGSGPDVPIVALTAHAMKTDRDRCLRSGMDGYIAKPIEIDSFLSVVEAFGPRLGDRRGAPGDRDRSIPLPPASPIAPSPGGGQPKQQEGPVGSPTEPPYDRDATLQRLGGDEELFRDLIGYYLEDYPPLLERLRLGLLNDDAKAVERAAHSLKGLSANCGAGPAAQAAETVEELGREGRMADAPEAVERLATELRRLRDALIADRDRSSG